MVRVVKNILTTIGVFVNRHQRDLLLAFCMVLVAWSFYHVGRIASSHTEPIRISHDESSITPAATGVRSVPLDARVVVSKNSSSKKYHYSWCGSGNRIKEENKVWYETAALAESAGYTLAGNCR